MPGSATAFDAVFGDRVGGTLDALYDATIAGDPAARRKALEKGVSSDEDPGFYEAMRDAHMPVTPAFGQLLYSLVLMSGACSVVEFGTSFGISTIFLAEALRGCAGRIVTTELIATKAKAARDNLTRAGLENFVEFRVGDALETLASLDGPVDFVLLDGPKNLYLPVLRLIEKHLSERAIIVSDNTDMSGASDYLEFARNPRNGYLATPLMTEALGMNHGHELVIKGRRRDLDPG